MKALSISMTALTLSLNSLAQASETTVVERGPHYQTVQRVSLSVDASGQTMAETNSYVQLTPGLHWFNPETQQWEETIEGFEITPDGHAVARKGPHQAVLTPNIATPGAVDLLTSDGKRFQSHVLGLSYFDPVSGQSALIAEVTNSIGELVSPNQVIYPNAFTDFSADVRFTYTKLGWEQDVILRERPPGPGEFGLNPNTAQLQVLTEFIDPPVPLDRVGSTNTEPNRFFIAPNLNDERLEFGAMMIGQGKAFSIDETQAYSPINLSDDKVVPVGKNWSELEAGRHFLIESVNYVAIAPALEVLPPAPQASVARPKRKTGRLADLVRERPQRMASAPRPERKESILLAKADRTGRKGYVIDYLILNTVANTTLKGDTTYYVTNTAVLSGVTVIEGGAVVKYTNGATVKLQGTVKCQTSAYRPAVFTSKDDDSVGEVISGSTGNPATNYPASTALYIDNNQSDLKYIRIAHADQALYYDSDTGYPHYLSHAQLVHCKKGILPHNTAFHVRNVLMHDVLTNFYNTTYNATGYVHHLTANTAAYLNGSSSLITLNVTNSLLVAITNIGTISGSSNATNSSASGIFQIVGAGNHYLATGSGYRNVGTTNICDVLKADLATMTTYPPVVLTNDFTLSTTLSPQAQRDSDTPDLGYHYSPLDYCWTALNLTNATLTLTNGVAVGTYGSKGTSLRTGGKFMSEGAPVNLNRLTRYPTVQEQSLVWGTNSSTMGILELNGSSGMQVNLRFTDVSLLADTSARRTLATAPSDPTNPFGIVDSRLRGIYQSYGDSGSYSGRVVAWTNNLMDRCTLSWSQSDYYYPFTLYMYNNLFYKGTISFTTTSNNPSWTVKDNLFDSDSVTKTGSPTFTVANNGYSSGLTSLGGSGNKTGLVPDYQSGPLGEFYYPLTGASTSLTNLFNAGSRNATNAGLYHHTTTVDQVKETNSVVDIGFHNVAVNPAESEFAKAGMTASASSTYDASWTPAKAIDGATADAGWHNAGNGWTEEPAYLRIDLVSSRPVSKVGYIGRDGGGNGVYRDYRIYVTDSSSTNAVDWGTEVVAGHWLWPNGKERRDVEFCPKSGQYVIFRRITADGYGTPPGYANANEIWIYTRNSLFSTALDYDGDGFSDYFEDRDGDGTVDSGETDWQTSNNGTSGGPGLQTFTPLK
jgi:F5/8 type C domain-containing protein